MLWGKNKIWSCTCQLINQRKFKRAGLTSLQTPVPLWRLKWQHPECVQFFYSNIQCQFLESFIYKGISVWQHPFNSESRLNTTWPEHSHMPIHPSSNSWNYYRLFFFFTPHSIILTPIFANHSIAEFNLFFSDNVFHCCHLISNNCCLIHAIHYSSTLDFCFLIWSLSAHHFILQTAQKLTS